MRPFLFVLLFSPLAAHARQDCRDFRSQGPQGCAETALCGQGYHAVKGSCGWAPGCGETRSSVHNVGGNKVGWECDGKGSGAGTEVLASVTCCREADEEEATPAEPAQ